MKKTFFLFIVFIAVVMGYFYYSKPKPPIFTGIENIRLLKIGEEGSELSADLVFRNTNSMRTQLGKINATILLNKTTITDLAEEFNAGISPNSDYHFPVRLRFENKEIFTDSSTTITIDISGSASSSTTFSNYSIPLEFHSSIKK